VPVVSVVVPAWLPDATASAFLPAALESLLAQTLTDWEAVVVDDGSPLPVAPLVPEDPRLTVVRHPRNLGLGAALNTGLDATGAPYVAYLPHDDLWTPEHLATLVAALDAEAGAALAVAGVRHHYNRYTEGRDGRNGRIEGRPLQLVQVAHRRTPDRWLERAELVTDDLDRMLWERLLRRGTQVGTGMVTCEWVDHPDQLHKVLQEPVGGLNTYRSRFRVAEPIRMHTTVGNRIDEVAQYRPYRERPDSPRSPEGLKILLCGELAYNADRVLALEERGHQLFGLWMPDPYWYNTVGPLPFGHVTDLTVENWRDADVDVIYGLLNWQAVPFAASVLRRSGDVPFVWHYKEGPFISRERGHWGDLAELTTRSDAIISSSPEMRAWTSLAFPESTRLPHHALDGDLPKADRLSTDRSRLLSEEDGEIHTVVPGRPIGLHPHTVAELAEHGVHLHFYGDFTHGQWREWIEKTGRLAPRHLHLHAQVDQGDWVREFSRYDAGWLHTFASRNGGDLRRADWDDLNYPARLTTLVAAGVPVLQRDNTGHVVATQTLVRERDLGLFFTDIPDLARQLRDRARLGELRERVWAQRGDFTFDAHADELLDVFRKVVQ
jgi:glycosyltransferase involved in cell wall biosynthesis